MGDYGERKSGITQIGAAEKRIDFIYSAVFGIVTINYTKADVKPISYGSKEIRDVVLYFVDNAKTYGVDPSKFTLMGYSAGAYYAADSTRLLQKADFDMASLVLCYPWTTGLDAKKLEKDFPPTLFILSGQDPISQKADRKSVV